MWRSKRQQDELRTDLAGIKTEIAAMNNTLRYGLDAINRSINGLRRGDTLPSTDSRGSGRRSPV